MSAMDTLDDLCSFTIVWLVTINYYETAQQLKQFITLNQDSDRQSLLAKPRRYKKRNKKLKWIKWIVICVLFVCYVTQDIILRKCVIKLSEEETNVGY